MGGRVGGVGNLFTFSYKSLFSALYTHTCSWNYMTFKMDMDVYAYESICISIYIDT